jgi:maltooligosyltrehalose synthase
MFNPVLTYRIQFHKGFTFADLEKIIPYLQQLGVKTLYAMMW